MDHAVGLAPELSFTPSATCSNSVMELPRVSATLFFAVEEKLFSLRPAKCSTPCSVAQAARSSVASWLCTRLEETPATAAVRPSRPTSGSQVRDLRNSHRSVMVESGCQLPSGSVEPLPARYFSAASGLLPIADSTPYIGSIDPLLNARPSL